MLKTLGRGLRTFMRSLDTANAIRHGVAPKHYDDIREPITMPIGQGSVDETEPRTASRPVAA